MRRGKEFRLGAALLAVGAAALLTLPGTAGAKDKAFVSGPVNRSIPNNDPIGVFEPVRAKVGKRAKVTDVDVAVRISHANTGHLHLYLFKGEKYVRLASGAGGGANFGAGSADCSGTFTIFNALAPTFIQTGRAPFAGGFRPSESLAAFRGDKARGMWRLLVYDDAAGASGTLNCWVLGLHYKKKQKKK